MVLPALNEAAMNPISRLLAGLYLILAGLRHVLQPGQAFAADILNMLAGFVGLSQGSGLIVTVSLVAGFVVGAIGLGMFGMAGEELGLY